MVTNKNKTVVITGCSSGIGKCAAETLALRGYDVIATVRKIEDGESLRSLDSVRVVQLDLADEQSVKQAAGEILSLAQGSLYALVNNAAYGQPGAIEDLSRNTLRKQFEVNLFGTHELTTLLLPALIDRGDARIIQTSSVLGLTALPMRGAYVASKFALEGLTDTLRMELSDTGVKVSLIEPGPIETRFRANALQALEDNIDLDSTRHGWRYEVALKRLRKSGPTSSHALSPEAVVAKLIHALESATPSVRYYVSRPTRVMAVLRRILPGWVLDRILLKYAQPG